MSSDYKVLVVVDLQNCFIQGGSLGLPDINDLKKYIDLVENVDKKIKKGNYDLVVFSKDSHPVNHSSLTDNTDAEHGVFKYHCRDTSKNCSKDTANPTTYMSSAAKNIIRDNLCVGIKDVFKEHFYDRKKDYDADDYNFYNPTFEGVFKNVLENNTTFISLIKEQVKNKMNDKDYNINVKGIKTLQGLIESYISDPKLDKDSKRYLEGIKDKKHKSSKVQGLDLNYLFYGTDLKDIIYALNTNSDSQIGITQEEHFNKPDYNDTAYNVDNIKYITRNSTKFITIAKGQYCDYESYSAFNYHTEIKKQDIKGKSIIYDVFGKYDSSLNDLKKLPAEKKYSTGLFEYILKDFKNNNKGGGKRNINIDVCGLVTNICVINTVHQGIAMWEQVYKGENAGITCKLNLLEYLSIPLPVPVPIEYLNYNYALQINKEEDLGKMLLQVSNLQTLFNTKFKDDVLIPNSSINGELSYTVDFNINLEDKHTEYIKQINQNIISSISNSTQLNFINTNPPQTGGKKLKTAKAAPKAPKAAPKTAKAAPKTAPKAAPKAAPKRAPKRAPKTAKAAP
jgi:nicotinamidase-related amidase